ncbi:MAG: hypothetical protein A3F54_03345 [Candidatus Kerfeldbacteria bacterium RIFCSPHIGHO2_12_FULL_48_17]|uniref:DUF5671 domain-containing protein n=1 Tax=Candidatus Kerfeldbacteria bacterium RIFCSPHIGHO2_12_FULL_48_17 TaxID=1798542 RepID=A0A1G2B6J6_9BACT|nr:MAG: hypothetical protein A3F54_03345 [Candidatus Kerfeldbacteria bacterium RIFCSPHIGHO2_12_FULL_48_17]
MPKQKSAAPKNAGKKSSGPKSVFLHILMIVLLYMSIISSITVIFQYINILLPDPLGYDSQATIFNSIRLSSAVLLIAFPVFLYVAHLINKDMAGNSDIQQSKSRRWLLHFTIFATALTIIIDLITLVYNFYSGDLQTNFLLKVLTVIVIAAAVLGYYRFELNRTDPKSHTVKISAIIASVLIAITIIAGFFVAGTPETQRQVRFDYQRINDLQSIQSQVVFYWQQKKTLPANFEALASGVDGFIAAKDPETQEDYEYEKISDLKFKLCADFDTLLEQFEGTLEPSPYSNPELKGSQSWYHPAGRHCFTREIDPTLDSSNAGKVPL